MAEHDVETVVDCVDEADEVALEDLWRDIGGEGGGA